MTYGHVLFYFFMQVKKEKTYRLSYQLGVSSYASTTVVGYFTKWKISFCFLQRSRRIKIFFSWKNHWNHLPFEKFSFWLIYRAEKELRKWKNLTVLALNEWKIITKCKFTSLTPPILTSCSSKLNELSRWSTILSVLSLVGLFSRRFAQWNEVKHYCYSRFVCSGYFTGVITFWYPRLIRLNKQRRIALRYQFLKNFLNVQNLSTNYYF